MPSPSDIGLVSHQDLVQPFMLNDSPVRGRMVRLAPTLDTILGQHDHPSAVNRLLGELLTLSAMLSSNLPPEGILTLQAKGDGPVRFLVADAVHGGALRGYADLAEGGREAIETLSRFKLDTMPGLAEMMGSGYLAITLDMGFGDPYQGIVPLEGTSLADAVQHYFTQSQQIDVLFNLAVHRRVGADGEGQWTSGGIMLERMPEEGGHDATPDTPDFGDNGRVLRHAGRPRQTTEEVLQGWDYNALLVGTATEEELLDPHLAPSALLYRLFNEGGVWVHETKPVSAECRCSRAKIAAVLTGMGQETIEEMKQDGVITVTCQFCNRTEIFEENDLAAEDGKQAGA